MDALKQTSNASKMAMKLLLSVSAFSAIALSYSSSSLLVVPFVVNTLYDIYVSAIPKHSSSFSSILEKSVVFLLCNGLLLVIFKNSVTLSDMSEHQSSRVLETTPTKCLGRQVVSKEESVLAILEKEEEEISAVELDKDEKIGKELVVFEFEEEEEETIELMDEFNKKCEDFIRRVKEEIKLGGL